MSEESKAEKAESKKGKNTVEKNKVETNENTDFSFEMEDGFSKEFSMPYSFHIKNLTDEKLYDVDLFNYDHEKQNKVAYSCTNGVDYNMFLRFLSSLNEAKEEIVMMRFIAVCDYQKFKSKQLRTCLYTIYEEPNGRKVSKPTELSIHLSAYQQQSDLIQVDLSGKSTIKIFNQLQLRLAYLMPEAEMHVAIFPQKINK